MHKIWLLLNGLVLVTGCIYLLNVNQQPADTKIEAEAADVMSREPLAIEVMLEKHYIDGQTEVEQRTETITSMEDFWSYYEDWNLVEQKQGFMRFRKDMNDISPYVKTYGYFGLKDGVLTIFEGIPVNEAVIHSFFHIDTDELESNLLEDLQNGIKIETKADYERVLETYRSYHHSEAVSS
ncbi:forespore regulator of the sigma-K checkpoint [Gracilibacillus ureilyticus]|uniref:Forespore regulator of the sigma-K checkpoint n=1 Tax=Gracilibacillus ureilyticus TaxID=531814 RepID=A0A1H9RN93_9BACI|nr:intercompartmental signaling factor BofC [Gracilibacillus ureilyticus]SER74212.1 forespore regulator of the sigma-K checkpoint [Gracilibacillus ureilyticus]